MSDTKKTELAPCPFCGKTPRLSAKGGIVCCSNLLCDIFSLHVGIEAWNTRPNDAKYEELLMAVARKFPNESRHETALRYITEAESRDYGTASEVCKQSSEGEE